MDIFPLIAVFPVAQEEYDELLKYAVVVPSQHGPENMPRTLTDFRDSFRPPRETFPSSVPPHDPPYVDESATQYDWGESPSRLDGTSSDRQGTQRRNVYGVFCEIVISRNCDDL